jgi:hypothetical protein
MTSTNSDSGVFGRELRHLAALMLGTQSRLEKDGRSAIVFPGHGDFHRVDEAQETLKGVAAHQRSYGRNGPVYLILFSTRAAFLSSPALRPR